MKTLLSVLTLSFSLFLFLSPVNAHAATQTAQQGQITSTIDHIEYDTNHNYIAITKDSDNGEWCLNIFQSDKYSQSTCDELAHILDNKRVTITYDTQNSTNPEDFYVTDWKINNITGGQN